MLTKKFCEQKLDEIFRIKVRYITSEIEHQKEYLEHIERLRTAYVKENEKAEGRK